ncbi:MAG TPA: cytochrome P450 [Euzebya sp.]|nr:cytochrome P450 [Euzebya sp.]
MAHSTGGRLAPGPRGKPVVGNGPGFASDIINTLMSGWRDHGDVVRFVGLGPLFPVYLLANPDDINLALQKRHKIYPKTPFVSDKWRMMVGEGLICSEGDFWRSQRRLIQPAFHRDLVGALAEGMVTATTELLDQWAPHARSGHPIDMAPEMVHHALAVLAQACYSADWKREAEVMGPAVEVAIGHAYELMGKIVAPPEWVPTPANRRFARARDTLDGIIYRLITERRRSIERGEPQPQDLLGLLMAAQDEDTGARMGDEQVRNEVMTFMFGGHETVASGLAWSLYLLSRHPVAQQRMKAEIDQVLGGRSPTLADLDRLEYGSRLVQESLRLYPPVWLISRTPIEDDEVRGYHIPGGSMVLLSAYVAHRHPDFWDNPEGFDPDRFLPERAESRPRHAWIPFSGGPRKCIGDYFGKMEMQIVLTMILQRYRLDLVPGHAVIPKPGITLGFKKGLLMTVHDRES